MGFMGWAGVLLACLIFGCSRYRDVPLYPAPVTPPRGTVPVFQPLPWEPLQPEPLAPTVARSPQRGFQLADAPLVEVDRRFYREGGSLFRQPVSVPLPHTHEVVPFERTKSVSKGFDGNRNNWLDPYEITLSPEVRKEASGGDGRPHNGIVGTTEFARAIFDGRVRVQITEPQQIQRVAAILAASQDAGEFRPSAWLMVHADLDGDGRLNQSELAQAMADGQLQLGRTLYWAVSLR